MKYIDKKLFVSCLTAVALLVAGCGDNHSSIEEKYTIESIDSVGNAPILSAEDGMDNIEIYGGFKSQKTANSYSNQDNVMEGEKSNLISYIFDSKLAEKREVEVVILLSKGGKAYSLVANSDGEIEKVEKFSSFKTVTLEPSKPLKIDLNLELDIDKYSVQCVVTDKETQKFLATAEGRKGTLYAYVHSNGESSLKNANAQTGGFLPNPHGFGFVNTGGAAQGDITNHDVAEMIGLDKTCYNDDIDNCILTANGTFQKEFLYQEQVGGQCYGFAVASSMIHQGLAYNGKNTPSDFNAKASKTIELKKEDVGDLIAIKHLNQNTEKVQKITTACKESDTLTEYQKIVNGFNTDDPTAVLAFFAANGHGGHAVMPYAVTQEANNRARIYIYDNNYPGRDDLYFEVGLDDGSWIYPEGAVNAQAKSSSDYYGKGKENPICAIPLSATQHKKLEDDLSIGEPQVKFNLLGETNSIRMLISKDDNHTVGYDFKSKKYVNTIDGVVEKKKLENMPSTYYIPTTEDIMDISDINSEEQLMELLDEMIGVDVGLLASSEVNTSELELSMQASSSKYRSALGFEDISVDKNDTFSVGFHPSGRILALGKENGEIALPTIKINFDNLELMKGVIHKLQLKEVPKGAAVIAFAGMDGEISIFAIGEEDSVEFKKDVHYAVETTLIDKNGSRVLEKQSLHQKVNSSIRLKPITQSKSIHKSTLTSRVIF